MDTDFLAAADVTAFLRGPWPGVDHAVGRVGAPPLRATGRPDGRAR